MSGNAVAKREQKPLPPEIQARVEENRARNQVVAAIRGTIWGKDLNEQQVRAVAQYAREIGVDPVRHVEVLGGKIYLTAELYDEKGAPLIHAGLVRPDEPEYINADERLDKLAETGDEWAVKERERRLRARIQYNVPEAAKAAVVQRFRITSTGAVIIGVNWCGGTGRRDPVGDAEPAKTAQTRARRRAWKQIAEIIPDYGNVIRTMEERAATVAPVLTVEPPQHALPPRGTSGGAAQAFGGYGDEPMPDATRVIPGQAADGEPIYEAEDASHDSRDPDQLGLGEEG